MLHLYEYLARILLTFTEYKKDAINFNNETSTLCTICYNTFSIIMNILIIGSGGREHALAWKIKQSPDCGNLYVAPGNAGTASIAKNQPIDVNDFESQKEFCLQNDINLIVVGPEEPLVKGIYDYFAENAPHIQVVGPSEKGAQLEGSKAFSKKFMQRHDIPTAAYAEFTEDNYEIGKKYIQLHPLPLVLKADGLAAGKGVVIAQTHEEALAAFEEMIVKKQFGEASSKVVVEQFLKGIEISVFILTDAKSYKIIGHAKDYKRIGESDTGLNTGGMGCVTPVPFADETFMQKVEDKIIKPTINGLVKDNITYKGFIFFGLINVDGEPYVIEYNARLGDPETEVVLPRLKNDLLQLFITLKEGELDTQKIEFDTRSIATVVAVSGGYPGDYEKGKTIQLSEDTDDSIIFHAGTKTQENEIHTNGGRVIAVTSFADTITEAAQKSKDILSSKVSFDGMYFRKDIGYEFE